MAVLIAAFRPQAQEAPAAVCTDHGGVLCSVHRGIEKHSDQQGPAGPTEESRLAGTSCEVNKT
jgi:hypothetical protein